MLWVHPLSLTHSNTNHKTNSECSGSGLASFDHDDFSGIKYYCVIRSCKNECMYSWQVKFNNEIIYYRHLTYYSILTHLSLKWLFFCLGIPKKFQEHDILTFSLLHVNNQDLIHTLHTCTAGSIKVALGIGNWAIVSYCLVVTQGNHCIVWYAQMPNSQPLLNQPYTV